MLVSAKSGELSVEIGQVPALKERIIRETNTGYYMACAERDLLGLIEEFINIAVELELADVSDGNLNVCKFALLDNTVRRGHVRTKSSGHTFVASRISNSKSCSLASGMT